MSQRQAFLAARQRREAAAAPGRFAARAFSITWEGAEGVRVSSKIGLHEAVEGAVSVGSMDDAGDGDADAQPDDGSIERCATHSNTAVFSY